MIDAGVEYDVEVTEVTGGVEGRSRGVNVLVSRRAERDEEAVSESSRDRRASLGALDAEALRGELVSAFIGEGRLHEAQQAALTSLGGGHSTLAVMATGRGKSLIFQIHACCLGRREGAGVGVRLPAAGSRGRSGVSSRGDARPSRHRCRRADR